jgi:hypothetical protein
MIKPKFNSGIDLTLAYFFRDLPSPESNLRDLSTVIQGDTWERHGGYRTVLGGVDSVDRSEERRRGESDLIQVSCGHLSDIGDGDQCASLTLIP